MVIQLSNIRFSYPNHKDTPILNIPSWSMAEGEHCFIHGPSGNGKSTLLNMLSGILLPNEGVVCVLDQHLNNLTSRQRNKFRADNIGYVFQQFNLIPYLDALENIQLASYFSSSLTKSEVSEEMSTLLTSLNIPESDWNKPVRTLSIGQQQRIAIARALINTPKLLIADEPTSALDNINRDSFMTLLMSTVEKNNITLLFVSHDMSLSQYFNRVESLSELNQVECSNAS
ncbi:ABC transporter ATP-binding protein [Thalassotalea profundi]|uniref:ABC transporter ATP-binding protein n=1 Tax=Thalassotalea profundi TaxID=2036687 RepID=A0ABQ3J105_9GAMM|nr:ABC transporter ATP-binding protein [Thalassotalea profundi]GHF00697.1 ABC transporter ATP-binding protein [Thalassotalea profundi]